ncbi:hypothetical protein NL386_38425, partial [Klebsiella pneumoniae]|nr:hypothetical protein [Klebsiella pneumoniae]
IAMGKKILIKLMSYSVISSFEKLSKAFYINKIKLLERICSRSSPMKHKRERFSFAGRNSVIDVIM